jgi:hypothetical protein
MTVKVSLEVEELQLQINGCPEQRPVETFAAYRADQAFDKGMRQRHVRHRLDGFHVENSQIRLPLMETVQRIMVRAEACCLVLRRLLLAVLRVRSNAWKELEIVVLRHELAILRRQTAQR